MNSEPSKMKNYCSTISEYRGGWRVCWNLFFGFGSVFMEIQSSLRDALKYCKNSKESWFKNSKDSYKTTNVSYTATEANAHKYVVSKKKKKCTKKCHFTSKNTIKKIQNNKN